jgi:hypothetical protein
MCLSFKISYILDLLTFKSLSNLKMPYYYSTNLRTFIQKCSTFNAKIFFTWTSLIFYRFPTPPIELKQRMQIGGRLLIAKYLDWPIKNKK